MTIGGIIVFPLVSYDLFGEKNLPVELTVPLMILGLASIFLGPAFFVFPFSLERRKKIATRSLILSISLVLLGFLFAKLHFPGANVQIILGVLIFAFFYGALSFKNKYEKWKGYARSKYDALFLSLFDFVGFGCFFLGILFRLMHWPLGREMTIFGITTLVIGTLAWNQKFKKEVVFRKETEDKLKETLEKIELQHEALEEKQQEIISSIRYAKRIQNSLLPTEKYIDNQLNRLKK